MDRVAPQVREVQKCPVFHMKVLYRIGKGGVWQILIHGGYSSVEPVV